MINTKYGLGVVIKQYGDMFLTFLFGRRWFYLEPKSKPIYSLPRKTSLNSPS